MTCLQTEDCWCAACTDRAIDPETGADIRPDAIKYPALRAAEKQRSAGPVDIAWVFEYGMEEKLSASVRCF